MDRLSDRFELVAYLHDEDFCTCGVRIVSDTGIRELVRWLKAAIMVETTGGPSTS